MIVRGRLSVVSVVSGVAGGARVSGVAGGARVSGVAR